MLGEDRVLLNTIGNQNMHAQRRAEKPAVIFYCLNARIKMHNLEQLLLHHVNPMKSNRTSAYLANHGVM